jgi:5-methylcytosine-specific restriction endonuclease McrA
MNNMMNFVGVEKNELYQKAKEKYSKGQIRESKHLLSKVKKEYSEIIRNKNFRATKFYLSWVGAVKNKDQCCKKCGSKNHLVAHHIYNVKDNPMQALNVDNGICLCSKCHRDFHQKYGRRLTNKKQLKMFLAGCFQPTLF